MARFPEDVCINAERWALIRSSSRLAVEMDLIETWCPALRPTYFRAPNNDDRIDESVTGSGETPGSTATTRCVGDGRA